MAHGLEDKNRYILDRQWLPIAPSNFELGSLKVCINHPHEFKELPSDPVASEAYQFNFSQLYNSNEDLRLYRVIQILNTPLQTLTGRAAGDAFLQATKPQVNQDGPLQSQPYRDAQTREIHLWFFEDQNDGDRIAVLYDDKNTLWLCSANKTFAQLNPHYLSICDWVRGDSSPAATVIVP